MSVPNNPEPDSTRPGNQEGIITPRQARAVEHRAKLEREESAGEFGTVPNLLARFSLIPTKGVGEVSSWIRENDSATVLITAGLAPRVPREPAKLGSVPRGGMANLSFMWMVNQVRQNLAREVDNPQRIDLGETLNAYLRSLGVSKGGHQYKQATEAMRQVLAASIQLYDRREITNASGETTEVENMMRLNVADSYELWQPTGNELEGFRPHAVAGSAMLRLAGDPKAVPMRMDVMAQLADSVIAQQALTWLTLKLWTLDVQGDEFHEFTWDELYRNITHNYGSTEKFRDAWKKQLSRVIDYFPDVRKFIDLSAEPSQPIPGSGRKRVIRIRRGAPPIVAPRDKRGLNS